MKDMLRTYNEYNKELGYVQGMSDLMAPIYAVVQDDAIAFWGFVRFMDRMVSHRHSYRPELALEDRSLLLNFYDIYRSVTSSVISQVCASNSSH